MINHKIKIPKKISKNKIISYFNSYGLEILTKFQNPNSQTYKLEIKKSAYKPEIEDLYRIHQFIILNKRITALEFGCGWSTLVILHALMINRRKYSKKILKLRYNNPFELFVLDNERKFLNIARKRINSYTKLNSSYVKFNFSPVEMCTFNNQICNNYKKLPLVNPDFIYLDGPDQFQIKNSVKGINIGHNDFMPMNCDILYLEPFLKPGTIVLTDGRTSNFRFLVNNLKRNWVFEENYEFDQHTLYLNEKPLGAPNLSQLKFYQ